MLRILLFQILHMTSQNKKHVTKSRKLTLALIMRPLIMTKKMATVGTSFVLSGIGPEYFWLWCQSKKYSGPIPDKTYDVPTKTSAFCALVPSRTTELCQSEASQPEWAGQRRVLWGHLFIWPLRMTSLGFELGTLT